MAGVFRFSSPSRLFGARLASSLAASPLDLLRSQPSHYIIASIVGHRHLLAPRDLLTIPRIHDARVGDRLLLSEVHELGSRDYTIRGDPILPASVVRVEATVVEHTKGRMERIVKFKKRKHYKKTVEHKQTYTRIRIGPFQIGTDIAPVETKNTQSYT
ncbi:hypothetical protein BD410DRAFT_532974 [Rickenella mellea]|uniref:Large ribosomal subunit protein bL21m n=1 Tax=Rickenella mellea TaxID=50990 RepID=A0A4Y7QIT6_9AGAM|nr:hypothetical protein BD410DRAFT_532974 [Rickenella mellea]